MDAESPPLALVAELTHRCPLGCPYCSNPVEFEPREDELDAATWSRVFQEAAALGVRTAYLSGGEPGARRDLVDIAAHAREAGLSTHLITSGVGIATRTMRDLWEAGLDHVHVSFQDADAVSSDFIAGSRGAFQRRYAVAHEAVRLGLPLTVNFVVHRANIGRIGAMVDLAAGLKAARVEIVHARYLGWALKNRAALEPTAAQIESAGAELEMLRRRRPEMVVTERCAIGSGERMLTITPSGGVLPCSALASKPAGALGNVRDRPLAEIWEKRPATGTFCAVESNISVASGIAAGSQDSTFIYRRM